MFFKVAKSNSVQRYGVRIHPGSIQDRAVGFRAEQCIYASSKSLESTSL
jgi:hypothetical protein